MSAINQWEWNERPVGNLQRGCESGQVEPIGTVTSGHADNTAVSDESPCYLRFLRGRCQEQGIFYFGKKATNKTSLPYSTFIYTFTRNHGNPKRNRTIAIVKKLEILYND